MEIKSHRMFRKNHLLRSLSLSLSLQIFPFFHQLVEKRGKWKSVWIRGSVIFHSLQSLFISLSTPPLSHLRRPNCRTTFVTTATTNSHRTTIAPHSLPPSSLYLPPYPQWNSHRWFCIYKPKSKSCVDTYKITALPLLNRPLSLKILCCPDIVSMNLWLQLDFDTAAMNARLCQCTTVELTRTSTAVVHQMKLLYFIVTHRIIVFVDIWWLFTTKTAIFVVRK